MKKTAKKTPWDAKLGGRVKLSGPWDCAGLVWEHANEPGLLRVDYWVRRDGPFSAKDLLHRATHKTYTSKTALLASARGFKKFLAEQKRKQAAARRRRGGAK